MPDFPSWPAWLSVLAAATAASFFYLPVYAALFGSVLAVLCLVLAKADIEHFMLPDWASLLVFLLGLLWAWVSSLEAIEALSEAVLKAAAAGGILYAIGAIYQVLRRRSGLGFGDVKLVAAAAPWITPSEMVTTILIAAVAGIALVALRWALTGNAQVLGERVPFGALLAPAFWLVWFAGQAQLVWIDG